MSSTSLTSASTVLSLTSLPQHSRSTTRPCVRAIASIPGADHVLPQFVELGDSFTARHLGRGGQPAILKFRQCQRDRAGGPGYHLAGHWLGCGCGGGGGGRRGGDVGGGWIHGTARGRHRKGGRELNRSPGLWGSGSKSELTGRLLNNETGDVPPSHSEG